MPHLTATRSELLARRAQIALAAQGRDLLEEKRDALKREFVRLGATVLEAMETLEERCAEGRRVLSQAVAGEGPEAIGSAALAAEGTIEVGLHERNVAGVAVVEVEKPPVHRSHTTRGYALGASSARIDAVADAFERQLDLLLDVVASELSLRRLAAEIARTTRRVNALDQVVIPRLEAERGLIAAVLEDRALDDRVRLMRARARRRAGA